MLGRAGVMADVPREARICGSRPSVPFRLRDVFFESRLVFVRGEGAVINAAYFHQRNPYILTLLVLVIPTHACCRSRNHSTGLFFVFAVVQRQEPIIVF